MVRISALFVCLPVCVWVTLSRCGSTWERSGHGEDICTLCLSVCLSVCGVHCHDVGQLGRGVAMVRISALFVCLSACLCVGYIVTMWVNLGEVWRW